MFWPGYGFGYGFNRYPFYGYGRGFASPFLLGFLLGELAFWGW